MDGPSRGGGGQHFNENRMMSRDEIPTRTVSMQRQQSSELSLRPGNSGGSFARPGGGLGSNRPGGAGQQQTLPPPPARSSPTRNAVQQQQPHAAAVEPLSEEKLKQKGVRFSKPSQIRYITFLVGVQFAYNHNHDLKTRSAQCNYAAHVGAPACLSS